MNDTVWQNFKVSKLDRAGINNQKPLVIWLTGLSGSGKSTLANALDSYLFKNGFRSYLLDGDNMRHGLNKDLGFDQQSRVENIRRIGEVAKLMIDAGLIVITAFISPYRADRAMVRNMFAAEEFVEVFLDVPLSVCGSRDPKGLYKKARQGLIKQFTGIDAPYEPPESAEIKVGGDKQSIQEELTLVLNYLNQHALVSIKTMKRN